MDVPDFSFEMAAMERGARRIAGVDEVGRGPLAGPVLAVAVVLDPRNIPDGLNDSKKLSPKRRDVLGDWLMTHTEWAMCQVEVDEIDRLNIYHASHLAMYQALLNLGEPVDLALVDGPRAPRQINGPTQAIVRGDARSLTIAAASIIAKVLRDRHMKTLSQHYPGYGWERNAGYPTAQHRQALLDLGVSPQHRRSFRPVYNILCRA